MCHYRPSARVVNPNMQGGGGVYVRTDQLQLITRRLNKAGCPSLASATARVISRP